MQRAWAAPMSTERQSLGGRQRDGELETDSQRRTKGKRVCRVPENRTRTNLQNNSSAAEQNKNSSSAAEHH
jgi:hypothetical protein